MTFFVFDRELGRKERESLLKIAEITKEGFQVKQQLIQEAMRAVDDRKVGCTGNHWHLVIVFRKVLGRNKPLIRLCSHTLMKYLAIFDLSWQAKLEEIRFSKGDLETRVEALRTLKETAEQPEREAKERHLKAWEGKWNCDIISPSSVF